MIRAGALLTTLALTACAGPSPQRAALPDLPNCPAAAPLATPPPAAQSRAYGVAGARQGGTLMLWTLDANFTINPELGLELQFADGSTCLAALDEAMTHGLRLALANRPLTSVELGVCDEARGACVPTRIAFTPAP